jgi:hypothetical protein
MIGRPSEYTEERLNSSAIVLPRVRACVRSVRRRTCRTRRLFADGWLGILTFATSTARLRTGSWVGRPQPPLGAS